MNMNNLTEIQKQVYLLNKEGLSQVKIAERLKICQGSVSQILRNLERKGYIVGRFWNKTVTYTQFNEAYVCYDCANYKPKTKDNNQPNNDIIITKPT